MIEKKSSKKGIVFLIIIIFIIPTVFLGYFMFHKKEEKNDELLDIYSLVKEEDIYKTEDGKYRFVFVDKNKEELYAKAKKRLQKDLPDEYQMNNYETEVYVFINNYLYVTNSVQKTGEYTKYTGFFAKKPPQNLEYEDVFIVNDKEKKVVEKPIRVNMESSLTDELEIMHQRFYGEDNMIFVYKSKSGYFFLESVSYGPKYNIVYTTDWKKIGYVSSDQNAIKDDEKGIFVYDNSSLSGEMIRFDLEGKLSIDYNEVSKITVDVRGGEHVLDYDEIEENLLNIIKENNYKIFLKTCDCSKVKDESSIDKAKCETKEMPISTIHTVITKLKRADQVENVLTSKICTKYNYYIDSDESLLNIFEADDISIMMVGVDKEGFAYHYPKSNVEDFLKSLGE